MIFPEFLVGPQFAEGDLVGFSFDDVELSLRLPVIPASRTTIDRVSEIKNFKGINTDDWLVHGNNRQQRLVVQSWVYEDDITHLDIATCLMKIVLIEHTKEEQNSCFSLNAETFRRHYFNELIQDLSHQEPETRSGWPAPENDFFVRTISRDVLDGFQIQLDMLSEDPYPQPLAYIPINRQFTLGISFSFGSLHYADQKNPYNEKLLHKLKLDLFDEFLSYVNVEYSGETLATIKKLKTA